jgi:hypothetical protein
MVNTNWIPNHFIPVLPIDVVLKPSDMQIQQWRIKAQRNKEKKTGTQTSQDKKISVHQENQI